MWAVLAVIPLLVGGVFEPDHPEPVISVQEELALLEEIVEEIEEHQRVIAKQELLDELGWYRGEVDGIFGPLTEEAVERFADVAEVPADDPEVLLEALEADDAPAAPTPAARTVTGARYGVGEPWATLAECESGNWINGGASFERGSARWDWAKPGTSVPPWGTRIHHGGLQHHPDTWRWVAGDLGLLDRYPYAYDAPPEVQVQVATEVQRRQGWRAWPTCARMMGLR